MDNIRVSVVMATFNGERYIEEQIKTILDNMQFNDELIITDDGSKDKTLDIVKSFNDNRIRIVNGPQKGVKKNFENGLKKAKGEYIFLSDQDDIWIKDKIKKVLNIFSNNPQITLVIHDAEIFNSYDNSIIAKSFFKYRKSKNGIINNILKNSYIGCCMCFKRTLLNTIIPIPKDIEMHDQWIGLLNEIYGKVYFLNEVLIKYRRHDSNVTTFIHHSLIKMISNRIIIIKRVRERLKRQKELNKYSSIKPIINDKINKRMIFLDYNAFFYDDVLFLGEYYEFINYRVPKKIKKMFIIEKEEKAYFAYLYFVNNYFNKNAFYYLTDWLNSNYSGEELDIVLKKIFKKNNYEYKKKKTFSEIFESIKYKIIIILKHYLFDCYYFKNEIKKMKINKEICDIKLLEKINILTGSINCILINENEKFFLKGFDIFELYKNEKNILLQLDKYNYFPKIRKKEKFYFIEEFLDGDTLKDFMAKNPLNDRFKEDFLSFSVSCLDALYQNNIIHRDIRPENIIVKFDENTYKFFLIDFGCGIMNGIDPLEHGNKYNYKIAKTIGNEYKFDNYNWDDAFSFLIIFKELGIDIIEPICERIGRINYKRCSLW